MYDNYILDFPRLSTPSQRALLLTALLQLDYHLYVPVEPAERKGGRACTWSSSGFMDCSLGIMVMVTGAVTVTPHMCVVPLCQV
jgi:hypothetical protein